METTVVNKNEVHVVDGRPQRGSDAFKFRASIQDISIDNAEFKKYTAWESSRYLDLSPKHRNRKQIKLFLSSVVLILAIALGSSFYSAISSATATPTPNQQSHQTLIVHSNTVSNP